MAKPRKAGHAAVPASRAEKRREDQIARPEKHGKQRKPDQKQVFAVQLLHGKSPFMQLNLYYTRSVGLVKRNRASNKKDRTKRSFLSRNVYFFMISSPCAARATMPDRNSSATRLGNTISALNRSDRFQTRSTLSAEPITMHTTTIAA